MNYTPEQQQAISEFNTFLNSDKHIFILRGAAGTGKTTLLREFVSIVHGNNIAYRLMAPTGRAAMILSERTGMAASTIHRAIYALDSIPEQIDDCWRFGLKDNQDAANAVYIVDEASMIADICQHNEMLRFGSGRLLSDLIAYCNLKSTNRKLIFVGDYAQLPPVMQSFSPALDGKYFKDTHDIEVSDFMLTGIIRQSTDSGIYQNANQIRAAIDKKEYSKFQVIASPDCESLQTEMFSEKHCQISGQYGIENVIVVTYSNVQALNYNKQIRSYLFGGEQYAIAPNDLLMVTRNNYSMPIELFNGMIVKVEAVSSNVETRHPFVGQEQVDLKFRHVIISYNGKRMETFLLDDFLTDKNGHLSAKQQKALYADFEQRMRQAGVKPKSETFAEKLKTDKYFNALQCKYGYAVTCHKAQGGEWNNVFIDMSAPLGKMNETYFRWAYTAVTRAKRHLWHMSSPDFSAIDQFVLRPVKICSSKHVKYYIPANENFLDFRYNNICKIANEHGISCIENRSANYQHRIEFRKDNMICKLSLWYNKNFYTGKVDTLTSKDGFANLCYDICRRALHSDEIPYIPRFGFQNELHHHILTVANSSGIRITNIIQAQWSDIYFIETDANECFIEFYFNNKHVYTNAQPQSTLGENDEVLDKFIDLLKSAD